MPVAVLHIDDDPNDTELLRAAARQAGVQFLLYNVSDGEQAVAYLSGLRLYSDRERYPLPSLILLDLKMPRATGFEILSWIRSQPELHSVPVIVLSGSELRDHIQRAYEVGANSYLFKPLAFDALVQIVKSIDSVWLGPRAAERPLL